MKSFKNITLFLFVFVFSASLVFAQNVGDNKMYQGAISTNTSGNLMILTKINGANAYIKVNNPQTAQTLTDKGAGFTPSSYSLLKIGDIVNVYGKITQKGNGIIAMDTNTIIASDPSSFFDVWTEISTNSAKTGSTDMNQKVNSFFDVWMETTLNKAVATNPANQEKVNSFFDVWTELSSDGILSNREVGGKGGKKTPPGGGLGGAATSTPPRTGTSTDPGWGKGRRTGTTTIPVSTSTTPVATTTPPQATTTPPVNPNPGRTSTSTNDLMSPIRVPAVNPINTINYTVPTVINTNNLQKINTPDSFFDIFLDMPLNAPKAVTNNLGAGMVYTQCPYFRCPWLYLNQ